MSVLIAVSELNTALGDFPIISPHTTLAEDGPLIPRLDSLMSKLKEIERDVSKATVGHKPNVSGRTNIVNAYNLISTVHDAILDDVGVKRDTLATKLRDAKLELKKVVNALTVLEESRTQRVESAGHNTDSISDIDHAHFPSSSSYSGIPKNPKKADEFILLRLPVVPVFKTVLNNEQLAKIGFKVGGHEGLYTILEDQYIVGINLMKMEEEEVGKKKVIKRGDPHDRAKEVAGVLAKRLNESVSIIGDELVLGAGRKIASSPKFVYYWVVRDTLLSRLYAKAGHTAISDWGFAFK